MYLQSVVQVTIHLTCISDIENIVYSLEIKMVSSLFKLNNIDRVPHAIL